MKEGLPLFPEGYEQRTDVSLSGMVSDEGGDGAPGAPDIPSALGC